jgi:hypothetical protein
MNELKGNEINFEGITVTVSEEKALNKFESLINLAGFSKLRDLIERYTVLRSLTDKSV